jgi:hypothetical protein
MNNMLEEKRCIFPKRSKATLKEAAVHTPLMVIGILQISLRTDYVPKNPTPGYSYFRFVLLGFSPHAP